MFAGDVRQLTLSCQRLSVGDGLHFSQFGELSHLKIREKINLCSGQEIKG